MQLKWAEIEPENGKFDFSVSDLTIAFAIYFVATRAYRKFKDGKEDGDEKKMEKEDGKEDGKTQIHGNEDGKEDETKSHCNKYP